MMRGAGGALVVAALLVCCSADPHQEQDVNEHGADRYDSNGQKPRNLDPLGGGNLVREVRESRHSFLPYYMARRFDILTPFGSKTQRPSSYYPNEDKRNFDEIDLSGLNTFGHNKRNFDEIDQTLMPFPYATKRFYHPFGPNYIAMDWPESSFDKKRYRSGNMDEIDLSQFPIGSKRSMDRYPLVKNFQ